VTACIRSDVIHYVGGIGRATEVGPRAPLLVGGEGLFESKQHFGKGMITFEKTILYLTRLLFKIVNKRIVIG
jgi:hypothetical protein